jgi:hypothetical protein
MAQSVNIECTKEGVKFGCTGDIGSGSVTLRQHANVDKEDLNVDIQLSEPVSLTFSLKYLVNFCKASGLSSRVKLCLSTDVPLMVEYSLANNSYLRFYLAPKVSRAVNPYKNHKLIHGRSETRSRFELQRNKEHDSGMRGCLRRFDDLLEEKDHTAKEHATGLEDDGCYYTNSNKILYHHTHAALLTSGLVLVTLTVRCRRQPALSFIS